MAEEQHVSPDSDNNPAWVVIMFAIVVPLNVLIEVANQWARFGWVQKSTAVVLLALLGEMPFLAFARNPRLQNRFSGRGALTFGYTALLLATIVFGSHHF